MPLKITFTPDELHIFCRVDDGIDNDLIDGLQEAAEVEAEQFLNTDFSVTVENEDGTTTTTENEAPATVKLWVKNRVAQLYDNRGEAIKPDFTLLRPHRVYPFRG